MTETHSVSIDEVRALVAERQRYDDWLSALEGRRAETPAHVFERVHADYAGRRRGVMGRLREHVSGLSSMANALEENLTALESRLGALEDERAEAMLRTAVGEFDGERWEQVRQDVESQIAGLGEQRTSLLSEVDEVRTLLASASSEPEPELEPEVVAESEPTAVAEEPQPAAVDESAAQGAHEVVALSEPDAAPAAETMPDLIDEPLADVLGGSAVTGAPASTDGFDQSLAMFANDAAVEPTRSPSPVSSPSLDGLDVFDDADLGDLRMSPPARSTATATPPATSRVDARVDTRVAETSAGHAGAAESNARDGFDDLAFLRSVVDPSAGGARSTTGADQQKTLRCTECGTMNLPTEWYCERCGGELAAF